MILRRLLAIVLLAGAVGTLRGEAIWLDVPFIRQTRNGCGEAAIAMLLQYWRAHGAAVGARETDPARIQQAFAPEDAGGISASEMKRYFEQAGFQAFSFQGHWEDLSLHLRKGRPLIVALAPAGAGRPLHYAVVAGVDAVRRLVSLNDPASRKLLKIDRRRFEQEWSTTGRWTLLAVPLELSH
ncbi:MAG: cysteine peptidase family C39 domain-containing protein [Bryobacteraceae bacterium]